MASVKPHFLLLPYSQQGHVNPMLSLGSQLTALGCKVTFVKAEKQAAGHEEAAAEAAAVAAPSSSATQAEADNNGASGEGMNFVDLGQRLAVEHKLEDMKAALDDMAARQAAIAELVEESKVGTHPISCVICDFFMWRWVAELADKQGLHAAALWTSCGLAFYEVFLGHKQKGTEMEKAIALPSMDQKAARFGLIGGWNRELVLEFLDGLFLGIQDAGLPVLVNSSKHLEAPIVEAAVPLLEACGCGRMDLRFIGPCLPAYAGAFLVHQRTEEEECLPWLEQQAEKSVLFVSMIGSEGSIDLPEGVVEEIAMGIEQSGCKCLWVVRPDALPSCRPSEAFQQRMAAAGRAMFVSWAPQKRVLEHAAVGGFLTHNGWNSTVESLSCGVPMVCLPLRGDQPLNAFLVYSVWQAGLPLIPSVQNAGVVINRKQVHSIVRAVMDGRFSARLSDLRLSIMSSQQNAQQTLASFVQGLSSVSHQI